MSVERIDTIARMRKVAASARRDGKIVGCVPTMGALHQGHGALIETALRECDVVVVTIFVNPIQFDRQEDFERYARTLSADLAFCEERGVAAVFAPSNREMYPEQSGVFVEAPKLSTHLCGAFRPGHFRGVATVVSKLFHIVQPDRAYFGEKDAQQLAVLRKMVKDLNIPVEVVACPTVRGADGLALSSRNVRLSPEVRAQASTCI